MTTKQMSELIKLSVKIALKEELQQMKREIISEIRNGSKQVISEQPKRTGNKLDEIQKSFRKTHIIEKPRVKQYSQNPLLNELLSSTEPVPAEASSYLDQFETEEEIINLPTNDAGRPINAPKAVIEAMNRDYSAMFKKDEVRQPKVQASNNSLRSQILNRMEGLNESTNFDEDEDIEGFLKSVG